MGRNAKMKWIAIILSLLIYAEAKATIIRVGPGRMYTNITAAVNAANTGDTVMVEAGTYKEKKFVISKKIVLQGINHPVLDGENKYEIIAVKSDGVVVDGFKIINSGISSLEEISGIKIYNCKKVIIKNNILENTFFGIYVQYGINCSIENNKISAHKKEEQQSGNGIHCWKSDSMKIIHNEITGHRDGIYFEFVTNSVIWRNISANNIRYGLHFMFSNNDSYFTNIFRNNGAGVSVMFTKKVTMMNNTFEENWGDGSYGLLLKEIADSYISGNHFTQNTSGIYMEGTNRVVIEKNDFDKNGWAMQIQASCMDNTISGNNFISNTFDIGTNGTLVLNVMNGNYWDKYEGYDLNKDNIGDIPFHPLSLFSVIVENKPASMLLYRSFMITLLDKSEKIFPTLTPDNFIDNRPQMKTLRL